MDEVSYVLALDVGEARIGAAIGNTLAKIPSPYAVLPNDEDIFSTIKSIINDERIDVIAVGLPRNQQGEETKQSEASRQFARELEARQSAKVVLADESLSSQRAEQSNQYTKKRTSPKYLDDIAACFILEEYLGALK